MKEFFFMRMVLLLCLSVISTGIFADEHQIRVTGEQPTQEAGDENNSLNLSGDTLKPSKISAPVSISDEYLIGPNDLLEVSIFRTPDLSRTVRVNSKGEINLPLIGVVVAGGLSSYELEKLIADNYGKNYLQNPQVGVFIKEFSSQKVVVEGSVNKPGVFPIVGRASLLQVIAMASGVDNVADTEQVHVYRLRDDGSREALNFNLTDIREGRFEDPVIIGSDVVVVGKSGIKSVWKGLTESLPWFSLFW